MALSAEEADAHIRQRENQLNLPYYSHRKHWPSRLFHHSPIENAITILTEGVLKARADPAIHVQRDIAGEGVIDLRIDAHKFVRLYFRPRTPTQFHIEGVRKNHECEFGYQAPILVMFVLDAKPILTRDGTLFSNENMQRASAQLGSNAAFLAGLPWDKVYHEGVLAGDQTIIRHRCAEVLTISPLELQDCLQWIYCRSEAERDTLLHLLGAAGNNWRTKIRVSDDIRVFNRLLTYVEHVHLTPDGVIVELHPRNDGQDVKFRLHVMDMGGVIIGQYAKDVFSPIPPDAKLWRIPQAILPGYYLVQIWLEDELAYECELHLGDDLV